MSIGTRQIIMLIREYLELPNHAYMPNNRILAKTNLEANTIGAELKITRDNESFRVIEQELDAGVSEFPITTGDFGRAFMVETFDGGADPYYVPIECTITPVQNRDTQQRGYPSPSLQPYPNPVFSFYTRDGQQSFTVTPALTTSAWFRIYYEVESYRLAFNDTPIALRDSFVHLLVIRSARQLLPGTKHDDQTYGRILNMLDTTEPRVTALFNDQKFMQQTDDNSGNYWGWERDDDFGGYAL